MANDCIAKSWKNFESVQLFINSFPGTTSAKAEASGKLLH